MYIETWENMKCIYYFHRFLFDSEAFYYYFIETLK